MYICPISSPSSWKDFESSRQIAAARENGGKKNSTHSTPAPITYAPCFIYLSCIAKPAQPICLPPINELWIHLIIKIQYLQSWLCSSTMCDSKLSLCVKSKVCRSPGLWQHFIFLLETLSRHALMAWPQYINPEEQEENPHNFKVYKQAPVILLIKKSNPTHLPWCASLKFAEMGSTSSVHIHPLWCLFFFLLFF